MFRQIFDLSFLILGVVLNLHISGQASFAETNTIDEDYSSHDGEDARDWLSFGHGYSNHRYSPLKTINRSNVRYLVPRWIFQSGRTEAFQAQSLISDGKMFVTLPGNDLVCLDAETGEEFWRYKHRPRFDTRRTQGSNRGASLAHGRVYHATNDGRLIALSMNSGKVLWDRIISKPHPDELIGLEIETVEIIEKNAENLAAKMPPLIVGNKVIVGVTTAGYGIFWQLGRGEITHPAPPEYFRGMRGYVLALDAGSGEEIWRWHTTPNTKWEGMYSTTTPDGFELPSEVLTESLPYAFHKDGSKRGGSSTWMTPAYDPDLGLLFLGTGNASPNDVPSMRPGDNLYANSLVALDIVTGKVRWYYQQVPHDIWGYDVASTVILFNIERKGRIVPCVGVAGKTGWFYGHDRLTGQLLFKSPPLVPQKNMFVSPTEEGISFSPGSFGGASWSPVSFDPRSGWVYVPAIHKPSLLIRRTATYFNGQKVNYVVTDVDRSKDSWGTLSAVNTRSNGKLEWKIRTKEPLIGGVLSTAGDLLFVGEGDGYFKALDSKTGDVLWSYQCGAGVNGPPVSYEISGTQFVAVPAGGHALLGYKAGEALISFALPE